MAKSSYYEGWGFNDTVKVVLKGKTAQRNKFFTEFKRVFPKEQIEKSGKEVVEVWVYDNEISNVKKLAKLFDLKATYNDGGKTDQSVAQIILQQLGGMGRLVVMTGAYNFVALPNGVSFKIKNRKVNYVKITLNGKDLYDIQFGRIAVGKLKITAEHNDIYFDQLIPLFEKETGMYLRLFKKGGFVSTQNRDMVLGQLKSIHHHEQELQNALKTSGEIEAWVLAKVQRATTDLSDVTHYIDGRKEFANGGVVEKYVRAYSYDYADEDGEYEVKVQFFDSQDENSDYIDEESIFVKTRKEAEDLEDEINNFGYKKGYKIYEPKFAKGGGVYVTEMSFKRLQHEFKNDTEIFNGEVVQRGQNQFKIEKGVLYIKRPNENWEKFSVIIFAKGGLVAYVNGNYDKKIAKFSSLLEAKKFAKANQWKYETIIFEDEIGDNIIVDKSDTFKDIDWLFSDKFDRGGRLNNKYANGGEIESFIYEDVEYPDSKSEIDEDEIDEFIEDWNERMETNYSSWEDFNKGEKYYKLSPITEYAKGGKTKKYKFVPYAFIYRETDDPDFLPERYSPSEVEEFILSFNEDFDTNYKNWEDFNKGENSRKFEPIMLRQRKFKKGGMVDLFEDYTKIPRVVQRILDKHSEAFEDGSYDKLQKAFYEVEAVGYTFDYGLDGQAYGLRPIGVDISELRGYEEDYEEQYAKGGMTDEEALHSLLFENGGMPMSTPMPMPMPQGVSVADANPYLATAKAIQGIAPQSVSALDQRIARKLNPDPNRPVFFNKGGKTSC